MSKEISTFVKCMFPGSGVLLLVNWTLLISPWLLRALKRKEVCIMHSDHAEEVEKISGWQTLLRMMIGTSGITLLIVVKPTLKFVLMNKIKTLKCGKTSTVDAKYIGPFLKIYFIFSIRTQNKMHSNGEKINLWPRNPFNKMKIKLRVLPILACSIHCM